MKLCSTAEQDLNETSGGREAEAEFRKQHFKVKCVEMTTTFKEPGGNASLLMSLKDEFKGNEANKVKMSSSVICILQLHLPALVLTILQHILATVSILNDWFGALLTDHS